MVYQKAEAMGLCDLIDIPDASPCLNTVVLRTPYANYSGDLDEIFLVAAFMSLREAIWYIEQKANEVRTPEFADAIVEAHTIVLLNRVGTVI